MPLRRLSLKALTYSRGQFEHNEETQRQIYKQFGVLSPGQDTTCKLKIYSAFELKANASAIEKLPEYFGATIKEFSYVDDPVKGIEFCAPNLAKENYSTGVVWIFNPKIAYASFYDEQYTRAWRIAHELGHAIVEPFLHARYEKSRRNGKIGRPHAANWTIKHNDGHLGTKRHTYRPLSIRLAQRSIEWESLAFRVQKKLLEFCSVRITDAEYAQEYNINISDATYRAITGEFGEPGKYGLTPFSDLPNLRDLLQIIDDAGDQVGQKTNDMLPIQDRTDLTKWVDISDQQLNDAIILCQKNGLAAFLKNYRQEALFNIPPLYDKNRIYR